MIKYTIDTPLRSRVWGILAIISMLINIPLLSYVNTLGITDKVHKMLVAPSVFAIFAGLYWLYDNFFWRINLEAYSVPNFTGRWVGYIVERTEYQKVDNDYFVEKKERLLPTQLIVTQTFSRISLKFASVRDIQGKPTGESDATVAGVFFKNKEKSRILYTWGRHDLTGWTETSQAMVDDIDTMTGIYSSNHPRKGSISLHRAKAGCRYCVGKIRKMKSNSGRKYLGIDIPSTQLDVYIKKMKNEDIDFENYRANQCERDSNSFHLTVVNPVEYIDSMDEMFIGKQVWIEFAGLGKAKKGDDESYFVVCNSELIQSLRVGSDIHHRDLHVTLGFENTDVRNRPKGQESLLPKPRFPLIVDFSQILRKKATEYFANPKGISK